MDSSTTSDEGPLAFGTSCPRVSTPNDPAEFLSSGKALKRQGRLDEAAALLQEGLARFPDEEWIAAEYAWTVNDLGDHQGALASWRNVRARFPKNLPAYVGIAFALRRLGRFAEADDTYRSALERFPPNETLYTEYAWSAEEQRDIQESIRRWDKVRAQFPQVHVGYVRSGILLRDALRFLEADAILKRALERFPESSEAAVSYAWTAQRQNDWPIALKRWELVILNFPQLAEGRCGAAEALMALGRYAEANNVLIPAVRMFPDNRQVATIDARLSSRRGNAEEALIKWESIRGRFPSDAETACNYALALKDVGRAAESEAALAECARQFPDDPQCAIELARLKEEKRHWPSAIEQWRRVLDQFPGLPTAYAGLGNCLIASGSICEAQQVFDFGRARFPEDFALAVAEAQAYEQRQCWPQAIERWLSLVQRRPLNPVSHLGLARTLRESGQTARSAQVLRDALAQHPQSLELEIQLALTLGLTEGWEQAIEVWEGLRRRYPHNHILASRAFKMAEAARLQQADFFAPPPEDSVDPVATAGDAEGLSALFNRFESLGDDCEFGLVQRIFQADAASLLRWSRTLPDELLRAIKCRFDGVGDPEHTIVRIVGNEYMTEDRRFSMISHSFTPPSMLPLDEFTVEQCQRLQWLLRRFLDNLTHARKIFVYKTETTTDEEILALYRALQGFSPDVTLLFVRKEDDSHVAGSVERVTGNLFVGRTDKFSTVDISLSHWVHLCRSVAGQLDGEQLTG